jgi:glycosyltransferase involved in cell wall biosynthesis
VLKVLVVTNMWPTEARPSLGPFVRDQVEALAQEEDLDVEVHRFVPPGGLAPYVREAFAIARKFRGRRFDIVHAHYGLSGWCALGACASARVVTFHGDDLRLPKVAWLGAAISRLVTLPATASGDLARSESRRLGGPGERRRVAVLPCGVDLERFRPLDRRAARERLGLDLDARYLLFPADPARPEKRHDRAAELAATADATLLTGGSIEPEAMCTWMNAADAVVVTSDYEGFGMAAIEALACDVPVLSTPVGVAPYLLAGIEGCLCAPFDAERWAAAARPHLAAKDPRVAGSARAATLAAGPMAERVIEVYRHLTLGAG